MPRDLFGAVTDPSATRSARTWTTVPLSLARTRRALTLVVVPLMATGALPMPKSTARSSWPSLPPHAGATAGAATGETQPQASRDRGAHREPTASRPSPRSIRVRIAATVRHRPIGVVKLHDPSRWRRRRRQPRPRRRSALGGRIKAREDSRRAARVPIDRDRRSRKASSSSKRPSVSMDVCRMRACCARCRCSIKRRSTPCDSGSTRRPRSTACRCRS